MHKSISSSYAGLRAQQLALDVTANNIANVNTVAYKEKQVSFQDLNYRALAERRLPRAGEPPFPPRSGRGVLLNSVVPSMEQGSLLRTGEQFDLAVQGEGFFRVIFPDGSYGYTQSGNFSLDVEGNLVMPGGLLLDPPLNLADYGEDLQLSQLTITSEGRLFVSWLPGIEIDEELLLAQDDEELPAGVVELGRIALYRFLNPQSLSQVGDNIHVLSAATSPPEEGQPGEDGFGLLRQGYLEGSNVDLATQMTQLIRNQRALQASSRSLLTADELWAITLNLQR